MTILKRFFIRGLICIFVGFFSLQVNAWSALGHKTQANAAFDNLSSSEQAYYRALSEGLNWQSQNTSRGNYSSRAFVLLSIFADELRDRSLREVFAQFNEPVPAELAKFADKNTAKWHYYNAVRDKSLAKRCKFKNRGELIEALYSLNAALQDSLSPKQEAITLAFVLHLIEDLHQPLHTFTRIDSNCESDRGGNNTCYKKSFFGNSCKRNLHAQWDGGFGVFKMKNFDDIRYDAETLRFDPQGWVQASLASYDEVYDLDSEIYEHRARELVSKNTSLSIARLVSFLQNHYRRKNDIAR